MIAAFVILPNALLNALREHQEVSDFNVFSFMNIIVIIGTNLNNDMCLVPVGLLNFSAS